MRVGFNAWHVVNVSHSDDDGDTLYITLRAPPRRGEMHEGATIASGKPSGLDNLEGKGASVTEVFSFFFP